MLNETCQNFFWQEVNLSFEVENIKSTFVYLAGVTKMQSGIGGAADMFKGIWS